VKQANEQVYRQKIIGGGGSGLVLHLLGNWVLNWLMCSLLGYLVQHELTLKWGAI